MSHGQPSRRQDQKMSTDVAIHVLIFSKRGDDQKVTQCEVSLDQSDVSNALFRPIR